MRCPVLKYACCEMSGTDVGCCLLPGEVQTGSDNVESRGEPRRRGESMVSAPKGRIAAYDDAMGCPVPA